MDLPVMQAVRLKGMATPEAIAAATGKPQDEAAAALNELAAEGSVQERGGRYRVTPEGRDRLDATLAEERSGIDGAAVIGLYDEFIPLNSDFKELVNRWQMHDGEPNDHSDPAYDEVILAELGTLHERLTPLLDRVGPLVPRLGPYPRRFATALEHVRAGEQKWFLHPLIDSYHQIWFEFHEELIGLAGLSRVEEAAEGRAD